MQQTVLKEPFQFQHVPWFCFFGIISDSKLRVRTPLAGLRRVQKTTLGWWLDPTHIHLGWCGVVGRMSGVLFWVCCLGVFFSKSHEMNHCFVGSEWPQNPSQKLFHWSSQNDGSGSPHHPRRVPQWTGRSCLGAFMEWKEFSSMFSARG